jgi:hypothetical protein
MGICYSGLMKWVKWCIIGVQNKTFDRIQYNAIETGWLQNTKILGNVPNYHFSLKNVDNYQFRSSFNIGNTPPMNRRSIGTKTFSIVIQNS